MKNLRYCAKWLRYNFIGIGEGYTATVEYRLAGELKLLIRRQFRGPADSFHTHIYFGMHEGKKRGARLLCTNCRKPYLLLQLAKDHNFYCRECMGLPKKEDRQPNGRADFLFRSQAKSFFYRSLPIYELRALDNLPLTDFFKDRAYLIPPGWEEIHATNMKLYLRHLRELRAHYRRCLKKWISNHRKPTARNERLFFEKLDYRIKKKISISTEEPICVSSNGLKVSSSIRPRRSMRLRASPFQPATIESSSLKTSSSLDTNVSRAAGLEKSSVPPVAGQETRLTSNTPDALYVEERKESFARPVTAKGEPLSFQTIPNDARLRE